MTAGSVAEVLDLYERYGDQRYDEELSQRLHAEQTAALAVTANAAPAVIAAALLHDVGHLLELAESGAETRDRTVDLRHEARGSAWLAGLFGPEVTAPIALHVRAKRYLCAVEPAYHDLLSAGSQASLARQGGPLDPAAVEAFEQNPGWADAVLLRRWDDHAKDPDLVVDPVESYADLLGSLRR